MRITDYQHPAVQAACDAMHGGPSKPTKARRKAVMHAINAAAEWFENEARAVNYVTKGNDHAKPHQTVSR